MRVLHYSSSIILFHFKSDKLTFWKYAGLIIMYISKTFFVHSNVTPHSLNSELLIFVSWNLKEDFVTYKKYYNRNIQSCQTGGIIQIGISSFVVLCIQLPFRFSVLAALSIVFLMCHSSFGLWLIINLIVKPQRSSEVNLPFFQFKFGH